jgi:hypothetical protein
MGLPLCITFFLIATSNQAMLQSINKPAWQSGQQFLQRIYQASVEIREAGLEIGEPGLKHARALLIGSR